MEAFLQMDGNILLWIQDNLRNPVLTPVLKVITSLGNSGIFWIVLTAVLLIFRKTRKAGIASAIALIFSFIMVNVIVKHAVNRVRPYEVVEGLQRLVEKQRDTSFPSGHASSSIASSVDVFKFLPYRRTAIGLVILAGVIAFSRLYVGVHYPTDVLGGVLFGLLSAVLAVMLLKIITKDKKEKVTE